MNGDHTENADAIINLFSNELETRLTIKPGILLSEGMTIEEIFDLIGSFPERQPTLIHNGFTDAKILAERLTESALAVRHVFFEEHCGKLYRKHFNNSIRVLIRDGFKKRSANRLHPDIELFSDLHATYVDEGMNGFGDFLIVGDDYSESGGPAYSVAIHLTFIDSDKDEAMYVHHFKSIRFDTPTDPAGKFAEALEKLVAEVDRPGSFIVPTSATNEFGVLHLAGHFPGLGYVKKLSMKHHIETLAHYLAPAAA